MIGLANIEPFDRIAHRSALVELLYADLAWFC
jgi:hypothetical protein